MDSFKLQWISCDRNDSLGTKVGFTARSLVSYVLRFQIGGYGVSAGSRKNRRMFSFFRQLQVVSGG